MIDSAPAHHTRTHDTLAFLARVTLRLLVENFGPKQSEFAWGHMQEKMCHTPARAMVRVKNQMRGLVLSSSDPFSGCPRAPNSAKLKNVVLVVKPQNA